jgi:polyhydroxyalkanoate synthesis regulator phasin
LIQLIIKEILEMDELRKLLLSTVGAAAISIEKLDAAVQDLIEKGKLSVKEGKELREELIRKRRSESDEVLTKSMLEEIMDSFNFVHQRELNTLRERVEILEEKLTSKQDN